jgi:hypothetical protein
MALFLILDDPHHPHLPLDQCFPLNHELDLHLVHPIDLAHGFVGEVVSFGEALA